jgi:hypothetical protein
MKRLVFITATLTLLLFAHQADAQCVMCKAVAEDAADAGGVGRGLNIAILYLMAVPYLILTTLYFLFFRKKRKFA